jgi:hypothetical protein
MSAPMIDTTRRFVTKEGRLLEVLRYYTARPEGTLLFAFARYLIR